MTIVCRDAIAVVYARGPLGSVRVDLLAVEAQPKHRWTAEDGASICEVPWLAGVHLEGVTSATTAANTCSARVLVAASWQALKAVALDAITGDGVCRKAVLEAPSDVEFTSHGDAGAVAPQATSGRDGARRVA